MKRERESVCEYEISMRTNKKWVFFLNDSFQLFFSFFTWRDWVSLIHTHTHKHICLCDVRVGHDNDRGNLSLSSTGRKKKTLHVWAWGKGLSSTKFFFFNFLLHLFFIFKKKKNGIVHQSKATRTSICMTKMFFQVSRGNFEHI